MGAVCQLRPKTTMLCHQPIKKWQPCEITVTHRRIVCEMRRVGRCVVARLSSVGASVSDRHVVDTINIVRVTTLEFMSEVSTQLEQICHDTEPIWNFSQHHIRSFDHLRNAKMTRSSIKRLQTKKGTVHLYSAKIRIWRLMVVYATDRQAASLGHSTSPYSQTLACSHTAIHSPSFNSAILMSPNIQTFNP